MTNDAVDPSAASKPFYRARFVAYRRRLTEDEHQRRSAAIAASLASLPAFRSARRLLGYWPMAGRREIDLRALWRQAHADGKQILLPVVIPDRTPRMGFRLFEGADRLVANRWGVEEPAGSETVPEPAVDIIVVPALGADRDGYRLGYGKGFYDAFLAGRTEPTVCPVFDACLVDALPRETHDVPVRYLVTESGSFRTPTS
jgi:5-formyltetrahydrofolate cyclo-ligase